MKLVVNEKKFGELSENSIFWVKNVKFRKISLCKTKMIPTHYIHTRVYENGEYKSEIVKLEK